ncbi:MAG: insulinase family protein, partial [Fusobacteriaceae bacterium]
NGIDVLYKQTDFDRDKINMLLFREEGSSVLNHEDYINSLFIDELFDKSGAGGLNKEEYELFLKGKNYSLSSYISDYDYGFHIYSDKENISLALDNLTTLLSNQKFDSDILENRLKWSIEKSKNLKNSPKLIFSEKMKALISNDNYRRRTPNEKDLSLVSMDKVEKVTKQLFSNFSGYKLVVTGSITPKELENLLIDYISALPGSVDKKQNFHIKDLKIKKPTESVKHILYQGDDAKATTSIIYPYLGEYSNRDRILFSAYSKILDIVLIEKIREDMAGVYSIGSSNSLRYENHGENYLSISYSSNPTSAFEISKAVQDIIKKSLQGVYLEENLEKIYENYRLNFESETKKNRFWFYYLKSRALKNRDYSVLTPKEYKDLVTSKNLLKFLSKAISSEIVVEGLLLPKNRE